MKRVMRVIGNTRLPDGDGAALILVEHDLAENPRLTCTIHTDDEALIEGHPYGSYVSLEIVAAEKPAPEPESAPEPRKRRKK